MSYIVREYDCPGHGLFEMLVRRSEDPPTEPCPECGAPCPVVISAPLFRPQRGAVARGGIAEKPFPHALDTEPLADGMPLAEWKAKRRALHVDQRRAAIKKAIS